MGTRTLKIDIDDASKAIVALVFLECVWVPQGFDGDALAPTPRSN